MIVELIRRQVSPGTVVPKPKVKKPCIVKGWGRRRNEPALVYFIPSRSHPDKPYEKGITVSEFRKAHRRLIRAGEFTRAWFKRHMPECDAEGSCNFTTIGGIFVGLGIARYESRGKYVRVG